MSFLTSWPRPLCLHEIYIKTSARRKGRRRKELKKGEETATRTERGASCHGGIRKRGAQPDKLSYLGHNILCAKIMLNYLVFIYDNLVI